MAKVRRKYVSAPGDEDEVVVFFLWGGGEKLKVALAELANC